MSESLQKRHRTILCEILKQIVPDTDVFLFGSHARGTAIPSSDVDIAIRADAPLKSETLTRLSVAFSESDLPFSVDVVDLSVTSPEFVAAIEQDVVLLCKKTSNPTQTIPAHLPM